MIFDSKKPDKPISPIPPKIRDEPWPVERPLPLSHFAKRNGMSDRNDQLINEPIPEPAFNVSPIDLKSLEDAMSKSPLADIADMFLALKYGDMIEMARGIGTVTNPNSLPDPTSFAPILHLWAERFKNGQIPEKEASIDNGIPQPEKPKNGRKPRPSNGNDDTKVQTVRDEPDQTSS